MKAKDKTIVTFISRLKSITSFKSIEIVDYWDADICSIGLKKGNKLAYISTYNYTNKKIIKYDFDFEIIDNDNIEKLDIIKSKRCVGESELISDIKIFFHKIATRNLLS
jgi:hypothetical protein